MKWRKRDKLHMVYMFERSSNGYHECPQPTKYHRPSHQEVSQVSYVLLESYFNRYSRCCLTNFLVEKRPFVCHRECFITVWYLRFLCLTVISSRRWNLWLMPPRTLSSRKWTTWMDCTARPSTSWNLLPLRSQPCQHLRSSRRLTKSLVSILYTSYEFVKKLILYHFNV